MTGKECKLCSCPALQNNAQKLSFQTLTFVETLTCCRRPYGQINQSAQADSYWVN